MSRSPAAVMSTILLPLVAGCSSPGVTVRPDAGGPGIRLSRVETSRAEAFAAIARDLVSQEGLPIRIDPLVMDSVRTGFDIERDVSRAPEPDVFDAPEVVRERAAVLTGLGIQTDTLAAQIACTPYMGGIPDATAPADPVHEQRRAVCRARSSRAVAVIGQLKCATESGNNCGRYGARVYVVAAEMRLIEDLEVVRGESGKWTVAERRTVFEIQS